MDQIAAQRCADYAKQYPGNVQVRAAYGASAAAMLAWLNRKAATRGARADGQPAYAFTDDVPRQHGRVAVDGPTTVAVCYLFKTNGWPIPRAPGTPPVTLAQVILGPPGTEPLFGSYAIEGASPPMALERPS
jgi:hypothetical protein